jgi:ParB family chromosome partitioning protein
VVDDAKDSKSILADVPVENIQPGKITARRALNGNALDGLASSIQEHGLIEPLVLRPAENGYEIVAGARRFLAAKRIGVDTLPAIIRKLSDSEAFDLLVAENLQREDLNPLEIAYLLKHAVENLRYSQRQLAGKIGKDLAWVNRHLRLLDLPRPVQSMLTRDNTLTEGHARHILALEQEKQIEVANAITSQRLTTRETEMLVRRLRVEPSREKQTTPRERRTHRNMDINDLEPEKWKEYSEHDYLQFYSVWPVTRRHDPFFGVNGTIYSGCCPLIVPVNCILRYTKENEVVLDPFVGSGTTLVACAMLKRLGVGIDINPEAEIAKEKRFKAVSEKEPSLLDWLARQRFIQGDSRDLSFIESSSIDLIFAHPPYLDMMEYGEKGTCNNIEDYRRLLQDRLREMHRVLRPTRFCCMQIGPYAAKRMPLHHIAHELALKTGFEFVDEIVLAFLADYVGYSSSVSGRDTPILHKEAFAKWFSIAHNVYHHNHEYLIILRKPD